MRRRYLEFCESLGEEWKLEGQKPAGIEISAFDMCYQLWRAGSNCSGARSMTAVFTYFFGDCFFCGSFQKSVSLWPAVHTLWVRGSSWGRAHPAHGIRCNSRALSLCPLLFLSSSQLCSLNMFHLWAMLHWMKPALHLGHAEVESCWSWRAPLCLCDCSVCGVTLYRWISAPGTMSAFGFTCFPGSEESLSPSPEWEGELYSLPFSMFYRIIISCEREGKNISLLLKCCYLSEICSWNAPNEKLLSTYFII